MRKLKHDWIFQNKNRLLLFIVTFLGYSCLFFPSLIEADTGKKIKVHPNAQKESVRSAVDLKAQAEAYNNQAIALFEEGRYSEAQELWEKAIAITEHPWTQYIDFETVKEEQPSDETPEIPAVNGESPESSPIAEKYRSGLSLLEQKEYGEAQKVFQEIDAMQPDYRNTKRYLAVIDELRQEEEPQRDSMEGWVAAEQDGSPEMAPEIKSSDASLESDPQQEEAQWEESVEQAEQKLQDQIEEKAEPVYQKALQHYKRKEYVEARDAFEQVQVLSPDYKLTAKYLDGIDDAILYAQQQKDEEQRLAEERARRQDELEFRKVVEAKEDAYRQELSGQTDEVYQQAIADFKDRKFEKAEEGFREVDAIVPGYKLTGKYLGYVQKARDEQARLQAEEDARRQALAQHDQEENLKRTDEDAERARQQQLRENAEAAYQKARTAYGQGEIEKARAGFAEVDQILPDYRSTRKYLTLIDEDMALTQKPESGESARSGAAAVSDEKTGAAGVLMSPKRLAVEGLYLQAKESYKNREFVKAKELFEKVDALAPDYQATEKFLSRIDEDAQREARYQQQLQQRETQRQERQKTLAEKRAQAATLAARRRQEIEEMKEAAARIRNDRDRMIAEKVRELYREAESDYKNGLYALAKERFSEVQRMSPGYRSTEEYLGNIAYEYGGDAVADTKPVPLRLEQEAVPVPAPTPAPAPVPVAYEPKPVLTPAEEIIRPKSVEPADELATDYDSGVLLFKRKEYAGAREKFDYVVRMDPGYKSAAKYLNRIVLREEQQRQLEKQQQDLARAIRNEKKARKELPVPAVSVPPAVAQAQTPEPAQTSITPVTVSAKNEDPNKELRLKAQELSQEAVRLYASRQFVPAREKFLEVEGVIPGYKSTRKYLARIDQVLLQEQARGQRATEKQERESASRAAKESARERITQKKQSKIQRAQAKKRDRLLAQAEKKYAQALAAYTKEDFAGAKQKFIEVEKLSPNYKETVQYLSRIDADIAAQKQKPVEVVAAPIYVQPQGIVAKEAALKKADQLFKEALRLYASKKFVPAREKFQKVEQLMPGYKTTKKYITLTDRAIEKQQAKESQVKRIQDERRVRLEANAQKAKEQADKDLQIAKDKRIAQQEKQLKAEEERAAKKALLEAETQKNQELAEKDRANAKSREVKRKIAQTEKAVAAASKRGQWSVAEQKISGLENFLTDETLGAANKEQIASSIGNLQDDIARQREDAQKKQQVKEPEIKQEQDVRIAETDEKNRNAQERAEKLRQDNGKRRQKQAQVRRPVPASMPQTKGVWVDPPDLDALELGNDAETLRKQYAQIQKERRGVQEVIQGRLAQTYARAVKLYNQGQYAGAKGLFDEIAAVQPAFRGTKDFLAKIDQHLGKSPVLDAEEETPSTRVKSRAQVVADTLDSLEALTQ